VHRLRDTLNLFETNKLSVATRLAMPRLPLGRFLLLVVTLVVLSFTGPVRAQAPVTHTVQAGENLFRIALYYGVTVDEIRAANGLSSIYIYVGQKLIIPGEVSVAPPSAALVPPSDEPPPEPGEPPAVPTPAMPDLDARTYIVQPGDTLTLIAIRLRVSPWELRLENGLRSWGVLAPGQTLLVPGAEPTGAAAEPEPPVATETPAPEVAPPDPPPATETPVPENIPAGTETYTVRMGDTLSQIASRSGRTVSEIARLNGIANPSQIYIGQVLRLTGTAPVSTGVGKLIVVNLSEQRLYAFEGSQVIYSFVASSGKPPYYTKTGEFRIQSKIPSAWGSTWSIWMPHWLGIYWAGSTENGIHALPVTTGGQVLWAGYLGSPISFGCIVLGTYEAQLLYEWADIGTPVSIRY
jgi:LysM repeat protein